MTYQEALNQLILGAESTTENELFSNLVKTLNGDDLLSRDAIREIFTSFQFAKASSMALAILRKIEVIPLVARFPVCCPTVYRGCSTPPAIAKIEGFFATGKKINVYTHKVETSSSIYVSASKKQSIAKEHAVRTGRGFIYELSSARAIDCKKWFAPLAEIHPDEEEAIFPNFVLPSEIIGCLEL